MAVAEPAWGDPGHVELDDAVGVTRQNGIVTRQHRHVGRLGDHWGRVCGRSNL